MQYFNAASAIYNMRRLERRPVRGSNSLWQWRRARNPLVVTKNVILMKIAKTAPLRVKNILYRLMGVRLGERVAVGIDTTIDVFFPELIEIGDDAIIGAGAMVLTHEFLQNEWRRGPVRIGSRCMIGARSVILAGVTIGAGASVSAMTLVDRDIPSGAIAYG